MNVTWGINKRIMGLFGAGVVVFALFAGLSFVVIDDLAKALRDAGDLSRRSRLTGKLQLEVNELLLPVSLYLLTGDTKERDNFDNSIGEISGLFAELKTYPGDRRWEEASGRIERDAIDFGDRALEILYLEDPVGHGDAPRLMAELMSRGSDLIRETEEFHRIALGDLEGTTRAMNEKVKRAGTSALVVFGTSLIFAVLLHQYLRVSLLKPLRHLFEGIGVITEGNLGHRLDIRTGNELGRVAEAFNAMSERIEKAHEVLNDLATHDGLTGLLNHREFMHCLKEELERGRRYGHSCALLIVDLDHFKRVNDTWGHPAGDEVLRAVAARVRHEIRPTDRAARTGGDELAILLPETGGAGALALAERVRAAFASSPITLASGQAVNLTVSIGVATVPDDAANEEDLIAAADRALYAAKQAGRNRVCAVSAARGAEGNAA